MCPVSIWTLQVRKIMAQSFQKGPTKQLHTISYHTPIYHAISAGPGRCLRVRSAPVLGTRLNRPCMFLMPLRWNLQGGSLTAQQSHQHQDPTFCFYGQGHKEFLKLWFVVSFCLCGLLGPYICSVTCLLGSLAALKSNLQVHPC